MSDDTDVELSVDEFAEYCEVQAGLLRGQVETMREEVADRLDELDDQIAAAQSALDAHANGERGDAEDHDAERDADGDAADVADLQTLQDDLEEKQAVVEAEQARMVAYQDLAADYADLATELRSDVQQGREAMERVVRFEADRDAPAYFDERTTVYEAAAESSE